MLNDEWALQQRVVLWVRSNLIGLCREARIWEQTKICDKDTCPLIWELKEKVTDLGASKPHKLSMALAMIRDEAVVAVANGRLLK